MPANARSHAVLTTESKVTIRGQTTIPAPVREALKLKPGQDSIHYEILPGGQVFMCRLGDEQEDHSLLLHQRGDGAINDIGNLLFCFCGSKCGERGCQQQSAA